MVTVFVTLAYILGIALWARPLVRNETFDWKALFRRRASSNP